MVDEKVSEILGNAQEMYDAICLMDSKDYPTGELAWEKCYLAFCEARAADKSSGEYEHLKEQACLRLAAYLASWGMYRGSSFVAHCDSSAHMPVVELLLDKKYEELDRFPGFCSKSDANHEKWVNDLFVLQEEMRDKYCRLRRREREVKRWYDRGYSTPNSCLNEFGQYIEEGPDPTNREKSSVSQVLITKVLMGAFGCVPAYDRFFCLAAKNLGLSKKFAREGFAEFCEYFRNNWEDVERMAQGMRILSARGTKFEGLTYPPMKVIDKGMWARGRLIDVDCDKI